MPRTTAGCTGVSFSQPAARTVTASQHSSTAVEQCTAGADAVAGLSTKGSQHEAHSGAVQDLTADQVNQSSALAYGNSPPEVLHTPWRALGMNASFAGCHSAPWSGTIMSDTDSGLTQSDAWTGQPVQGSRRQVPGLSRDGTVAVFPWCWSGARTQSAPSTHPRAQNRHPLHECEDGTCGHTEPPFSWQPCASSTPPPPAWHLQAKKNAAEPATRDHSLAETPSVATRRQLIRLYYKASCMASSVGLSCAVPVGFRQEGALECRELTRARGSSLRPDLVAASQMGDPLPKPCAKIDDAADAYGGMPPSHARPCAMRGTWLLPSLWRMPLNV